MTKFAAFLRLNWFFPLVLLLFAIVWALSAATINDASTADIRALELALLADVFVTLPVLFWLCFRNQSARQRLALGIVAAICSGLWFATWVVPAESQGYLRPFAWVRYIGVAIIVTVEVGLVVGIARIIWKPEAEARDIEALGVPPMVARLMMAEARFWRWVLHKFRK